MGRAFFSRRECRFTPGRDGILGMVLAPKETGFEMKPFFVFLLIAQSLQGTLGFATEPPMSVLPRFSLERKQVAGKTELVGTVLNQGSRSIQDSFIELGGGVGSLLA